MGNAAAHRATGIRRAADRRTGMSLPLPGYVSADTAHGAFADRLLQRLADVPAYRLTFTGTPTAALCRTLIGTVTAKQANAVAEIGYAVTGERRGDSHIRREQGLDNVPDNGRLDDELKALELREEAAAIMMGLSPICCDTIGRLVGGLGCPDDMNPATWRRRVSDAREAFRAEWQVRNAPLA